MPSNHLILCRPLLLLPSIFPSIGVFSNESALHIRWPNYWSFSLSISLSNEHPGLISFRMDWLDLLAVQEVEHLKWILWTKSFFSGSESPCSPGVGCLRERSKVRKGGASPHSHLLRAGPGGFSLRLPRGPLLDEGGTFILLGRLPLSHDGKWTTELWMFEVTEPLRLCVWIPHFTDAEIRALLFRAQTCGVNSTFLLGRAKAILMPVQLMCFCWSSSQFQPMILDMSLHEWGQFASFVDTGFCCGWFEGVCRLYTGSWWPPEAVEVIERFDSPPPGWLGRERGSSQWLSGKESVCNAGNTGSILRLERCPEGRHSNALQYSCLRNPMDRGAWRAAVRGVAESQTRLSDWACTRSVCGILPWWHLSCPRSRAPSERLSLDYPASSSPGPSTDTLSPYISCPPTQQNAREAATVVLILFVFQRELFGLLILSVFQRGLFGLSQFD